MPSRATPATLQVAADSTPASAGPPSKPASLPTPGAGSAASHGSAVRRLASDAVFAGAAEVLICHHGVDYRLRQTTLGKLILTK